MPQRLVGRSRRKRRIRKKVNGTQERPRLTVFRSHRQIYAQVIDDSQGTTLASVSSLTLEPPPPPVAVAESSPAKESDKEKGKEKKDGEKKKEKKALTTKAKVAHQVGQKIATACLEKGIKKVVFDRNGYLYHGRVKALADGVRKGGVNF
jgi:large subunit ribosomal protein L18